MIRSIIAYGDPVLKQKAEKINLSQINELKLLIRDLWDTMYNAKGVGIAAPQIGVSKAVFVADFSFFKDEENFFEEELIKLNNIRKNIEKKILNEINFDELEKKNKNVRGPGSRGPTIQKKRKNIRCREFTYSKKRFIRGPQYRWGGFCGKL